MKIKRAIPFYLAFLNLIIFLIVISMGGWWLLLGLLYLWLVLPLVDYFLGADDSNLDPLTPEAELLPFSLVTWLWPLMQVGGIFYTIYLLTHADRDILEIIVSIMLLSVSSAIAGIVIAHELAHRTNRGEVFLGDLLLGTVLYGHFHTEHNLVHHRYVGTARDAATARYGEGLYRFIARVIPGSFISAFKVEAAQRRKKNLPAWHYTNPFYLYTALGFGFVCLAFLIGGWAGLIIFFAQAINAIFLLETTNYIEHYGLTRRHLGDGKYEPVAYHHSWNANHRVTNHLFINLQRHSDHHYKPLRRYPVLQALDEAEAPQLPFGYLTMAFMAFHPKLWRKIMNPKVRKWREIYYPDIVDWDDYTKGTLPNPDHTTDE